MLRFQVPQEVSKNICHPIPNTHIGLRTSDQFAVQTSSVFFFLRGGGMFVFCFFLLFFFAALSNTVLTLPGLSGLGAVANVKDTNSFHECLFRYGRVCLRKPFLSYSYYFSYILIFTQVTLGLFLRVSNFLVH